MATQTQQVKPNNQFTFETHVIPFGGLKKVATGGKPETHTLQSFAADVIGAGATYTMVHQHTRWPKDIPTRPDLARGVKTPRIKENFISRQELTGDDDRQIAGVKDFWMNDSFFSKYGAMFAESSSSKPGAEKGHPIIIFDIPITNIELYEEALRAWIHRYDGKTDKAIKSGERLVYNKPGARVHMLGNICPWDVYFKEIIIPYRQYERARLRATAAEQSKRKQQGAGANVSNWTHIDQAIADLGNMAAGDDRHGALFKLAIHHGGALPQSVKDACKKNKYLADYAKTDAEIGRVWDDGARLYTEPEPEPAVSGIVEPDEPALNHRLMAAYANKKLDYDMTGSVGDHLADEFSDAIDEVEKAQNNLRSIKQSRKKANLLPYIDFGIAPKHTCSLGEASLSVITFRENGGVSLNAIDSHDWRNCGGCMHKRIKRAVLQIATEQYIHNQTFYQQRFDSVADWQRQRDAWRQRALRHPFSTRRVRFIALPQAGGEVYVLHTSKEDATNKNAMSKYTAVTVSKVRELMETPAENRMRGSKGFGGNYQGTRGDGRTKGDEGRTVQYIGYANIEQAAKELGMELTPQQTADSPMDIVEAYRRLEAAGVELRLKRAFVGYSSWFEALLENDVTLNVHRGKNGSMYTKCDMAMWKQPDLLRPGDSIPFTPAEVAQYAT